MHIAQQPTAWQSLPEDQQAALAYQALRRRPDHCRSGRSVAVQFQPGVLQDRGASDALRLFAALLRESAPASMVPAGNA